MAKGTFGERLKRERELREVTLEEVSKATRISHRFLEALENEDWSKLPGGVFGRGFVRTIARYLGLSEEGLLAEYDLVRGESAVPAHNKPEERIPSPPKWVPVAAVLVALLVLAGLVAGGIYGWRKYKAHRQTKPSASFRTTSVSVSEKKTMQTQPASGSTSKRFSTIPLELSFSTSAATRVRIHRDNKIVPDAELPAGENRQFTAADRLEVSSR